MIHNKLGWIFLKLAEWGVKEIKLEQITLQDVSKNPAEISEVFFNKSLDFNPNNKLTHANLCLLYATETFREKEEKNYLNLCRFHGLKALEIDDSYINGNRDLSFSLLRYGEFDEAHKYYEKALQLAKNVEKDQEIISDALKVLKKIDAKKRIVEKWSNPDKKLLEPGKPTQGD